MTLVVLKVILKSWNVGTIITNDYIYGDEYVYDESYNLSEYIWLQTNVLEKLFLHGLYFSDRKQGRLQDL